ncbi:Aconitate hydratase [Enhygromyxa salina]|uniref:Aconitate hydratase A n=1 Tax=Enhygromyxa salina TaxID=215803 RepID=A0A0C2A0H1_9BACT|nr:aconitate hydratase [Enhygromyxa salina]KIG16873.1 Aconitate hydratase [Enhygromyxa salina]
MNSFDARANLDVGGKTYEIYRLDVIPGYQRLPYSLKVLLENLLRNEDGALVTKQQVQAVASWDPLAEHGAEIQYTPARVLLQDFTGVPCVVDLVAMRDAMAAFGGDPQKINPLIPSELVIDHSVIADAFGTARAFQINANLEFSRNKERYQLLRWGQQAFDDFLVVPPDTGICHQVNLEYLSRVVFTRERGGVTQAYCDTLVGTDSHTPMVNGLGVLGWGVGGIEAEAAMLGQPMSMLVPPVVGVKLTGKLPDAATATDLVLTVANVLRQTGVVGKFVEFFGPGVTSIPLATRATLGNMSPEYGSTCAIFPIDAETLTYLRLTGRAEDQVRLVKAYAKAQGLWHDPNHAADYSLEIELDLATVEPSIAGPKRPQDRIPLRKARKVVSAILTEGSRTPEVLTGLDEACDETFPASDPLALTPLDNDKDTEPEPIDRTVAQKETPWRSNPVAVTFGDGSTADIDNGHVVIAAITSCTNTSNPEVMIGAGLMAKRAVELGLSTKPWVKTTLAPGSRVVTDYYEKAGLTPFLDALGFNLVGYGCTTCIGNSGPLIPEVARAVSDSQLNVSAVLSGNRNFEGRIHPQTQMNFLASPPLVVAYALAGTMNIDLLTDSLGEGSDGQQVYLRDIWPSREEVLALVSEVVQSNMFTNGYADVFAGDRNWQSLEIPDANMFAWDNTSTYVRQPPFFAGMPRDPQPLEDISDARVLALLGDSVTTDHISPAGSIKRDSPAGEWLESHGVEPGNFNSYGARRGNHEVMIRGTFANIRLRNQLVPGVEGGETRHLPGGERMSIFAASQQYQADGVPLLIIAGAEYGSGSSRDWAAKGTLLLGVKAVLATSFERIHRSNLIGMGVLPLQFLPGDTAARLGLSGEETYSIRGLEGQSRTPERVTVCVTSGATTREFEVAVRIDTPAEAAYYQHGGILQYVLRQLLTS